MLIKTSTWSELVLIMMHTIAASALCWLSFGRLTIVRLLNLQIKSAGSLKSHFEVLLLGLPLLPLLEFALLGIALLETLLYGISSDSPRAKNGRFYREISFGTRPPPNFFEI